MLVISHAWLLMSFPIAHFTDMSILVPLVSSDSEDELPIIHEPKDHDNPDYEPSTTPASSLLYNDGSDGNLLLLRGLGTGTVKNLTLSSGKPLKAAGTVEKNKSALSKFHVPSPRRILSQPKTMKQ